jgi:UDP-N-acetyl-D-glucosamine dehydrogenase
VIRHLIAGGADVRFADPHVETVQVGDRVMTRVPLDAAALEAADVVVVTTDHTAFPWDLIAASSRLIVDARGAVPVDRVRGTLLGLSGPPLRRAEGAKPAAPVAGGVRV